MSQSHGRQFTLLGLTRLGLFFASLYLFVLAITLMKLGAHALAPLLNQLEIVENVADGLGLGWLATYVLMSGSPVAAAALTFFDAGILDESTAFAMITGSRLGATFIVIFVGFVYLVRGRDRVTSLSMGLLSLVVTASTYALGFVLGLPLLHVGAFKHWQPVAATQVGSSVALVLAPITQTLAGFLPQWALFPAGVGLIITSFNLFDRCLPQTAVKESQVGRVSQLIYRPWVMLLLGASITLITMSVSVSLGILVPLSDRGFIRRENVIPYIMGANVTTFVDTLLAAMLLTSPVAFTIVVVQIVSVMAASVIILATFYRRYERLMLQSVSWIINDVRHLALSLLLIVLVPALLVVA